MDTSTSPESKLSFSPARSAQSSFTSAQSSTSKAMDAPPVASSPPLVLEPMELDSDIEVLDSASVAQDTPTANRTAADVKSGSKVAKGAADGASKGSKVKKDKAPAKPVKAKKGKVELPVVALKNGKFVLRQKVLSSDKLQSVARATLAFTDFLAEWLKTAGDAALEEYPQEHWSFIATIVHESDKTLPLLAKAVCHTIIEYAKGTTQALEDPSITWTKRIPQRAISQLIEQLAVRENYGLEADDLPDSLPEGTLSMPPVLELWRWEVNDASLLATELSAAFVERRAERVEAKELCKSLFLALEREEQEGLMCKVGTKRGRPSAAAKEEGVDASPAVTKKQKVVKTPKKEVDDEEKLKVEAEKELAQEAKEVRKAEKEAEKAERDAVKAEKDAVKEVKRAEKAEKDAVKAKKAEALKKQSGMLSNFLKKVSTSPAPQAFASSPHASLKNTPTRPQESEFDRVFKPFNKRADVTVAPVNRFLVATERRKSKGKAVDFEINTIESLTAKDALHAFLAQAKAGGFCPPRSSKKPMVTVRDVVQAINDSKSLGTDAKSAHRALRDRTVIPMKHLQFASDERPGFVGTWTKISRVVGPCKPFGQDVGLLRYDYDSEAEWEEASEGGDSENIDSGEDAEEDDDEVDSDAESWLAADDEIEESEERASGPPALMGDDDMIVEETEETIKAAVEARKRRDKKLKATQDALRKKRAGPFLPVIKGPAWETHIGVASEDGFRGMRIRFLNDAACGLNPLTFASKAFPVAPKQVKPVLVAATPVVKPKAVSAAAADGAAPAPAKPKVKAKPLPASVMPKFVQLIRASSLPKKELRISIHEALKAETGVSKGSIDVSWQACNIRKAKGGGWTVPDDVLTQYAVATTAMDFE